MATLDYSSRIRSVLDTVQSERERIMADDNLSVEGKRTKLERTVNPLLGEAQQLGGWWLTDAKRQADAANKSLAEAKRIRDAKADFSRRQYLVQSLGEMVNYSSWPEIHGAMMTAIDNSDLDALAAWEALTPRLRSKFDAQAGPASDAQSGLVSATIRVKEAIAAQEPPEVKAAAEASRRAAEALETARNTLDLTDFERKMRGEPALYDAVLHPRETISETGTEKGYFTSSGGNGLWS